MTDPIPARLAALKTMALPELKAEWRTLFGTEPPGYNRRYLESRLAYRIQELAYGGLKPETRQAARGAGRAVRRPQHHPPPHPRTTSCRSPAPGCSASGRGSSTPSPC